MANNGLQSSDFERALLSVVSSDVVCKERDDVYVLDTPYTLQDGHLFQAHILVSREGTIVVSDGLWLLGQIVTFSSDDAAFQQWKSRADSIARRLHLTWDGEQMSYIAESVTEAMNRVAVLARAIDSSLCFHAPVQRETARKTGYEISPEFVHAELDWSVKLNHSLEERGLRVIPDAKIDIGIATVVVSQVVRQDGSEAAVELLRGRQRRTAVRSIDHAVTNFQLLDHFAYSGLMLAVFEERSATRFEDMQARFKNAAPSRTELIADSEAVETISSRLRGSLR
jgi:hypothetical protein